MEVSINCLALSIQNNRYLSKIIINTINNEYSEEDWNLIEADIVCLRQCPTSERVNKELSL